MSMFLVLLRFRSSHSSVRRTDANFGIGALETAGEPTFDHAQHRPAWGTLAAPFQSRHGGHGLHQHALRTDMRVRSPQALAQRRGHVGRAGIVYTRFLEPELQSLI